MVRLGLVALDGTKVKANASLDANRTASSIKEQISRMLADAEATDAQEDRQFGAERGDVLPKDLARSGDRLARLKACQEKLERRAAEAAARQPAREDRGAGGRGTGNRQAQAGPQAQAGARVGCRATTPRRS